MGPISIEEQVIVGINEFGFRFAVGRVDDRWVGYAFGGGVLLFFAQVSEGHVLGLTDRDEAIRRTGAVARDPARGFGGIAAWSVPEDLRGDPEDYRCAVCGEVCCDGEHDPEGDDEGW